MARNSRCRHDQIVTQQPSFVWLFVDHLQPPYRNTFFFDDVTVVLVSKQFYNSQIFVRSYFLRGPGWKANFIPKGKLVQAALQHTLVSVEPQALRQAVEARWHAFRDQAAAERTRTSVPAAGHSSAQITAASCAAPGSNVVAMGDNPRTISRWDAVKIIVCCSASPPCCSTSPDFGSYQGRARSAKHAPRRVLSAHTGRSCTSGRWRKIRSVMPRRRSGREISMKPCEKLSAGSRLPLRSRWLLAMPSSASRRPQASSPASERCNVPARLVLVIMTEGCLPRVGSRIDVDQSGTSSIRLEMVEQRRKR